MQLGVKHDAMQHMKWKSNFPGNYFSTFPTQIIYFLSLHSRNEKQGRKVGKYFPLAFGNVYFLLYQDWKSRANTFPHWKSKKVKQD
jgi:hypothetical protein